MAESSLPDLDALIASTLDESVAARVTRFPSGAVSMELRKDGHRATIQGLASGDQWGVSFDVADGDGFTGHDHVFASPEEALTAARRLLDGTTPAGNEQER